MPTSKSSWEDLLLLQQQYPTLDLGDNVSIEEGGNVMCLIKIECKSQGVQEIIQEKPNREEPGEAGIGKGK